MARDPNRLFNRYVDTTSPSIWPQARGANYRNVTESMQSVGSIDKASLFRKWTVEGLNSCYKEINQGLLNDDYYTLQKHATYINELRMAIKQNRSFESIKVYRGIKLDSSNVDQIKANTVFLWPTFSSTSRQRSIAEGFGHYLFEIDASSNDGTYRADINSYSAYQESEVLFYPYSGFRVRNVLKDARVIQLECVDTLQVETTCTSSSTASPNFYANTTHNPSSFNSIPPSYSSTNSIHTAPNYGPMNNNFITPSYGSNRNMYSIPAHTTTSVHSTPGGFYLSPNSAPTILHTPVKNHTSSVPFYNSSLGVHYHYNGQCSCVQGTGF